MVLPKAVLFDLDGTLIDSAPDLATSVNIVLAAYGHAPLGLADVTAMIGDGLRKLVERAFVASGAPLDPPGLDEAYRTMMDVYGAHAVDATTLLPDAASVLAAWRAAGVSTAVVTNKPQALTEAILAHFDLAPLLDIAIGGDTGLPRKPAPDMLLGALDRLGASVDEAIMVGDGPADVAAARAAGVRVIVLRGGYTKVPAEALGADQVIDGLAEIAPAVWPARSARS